MAASRPIRKLTRQHFAFARAVLQGLNPASSWGHYLAVDGEHTDLRLVKRTLIWLRQEFALAAHRHGRPGTARLLRFDAQRLPVEAAPPTLDEFAAEQGMEDFGEAEILEAWNAAYGASAGKGRRGARLIERQLQALQWLEGLLAQDPSAADPVEAWLAPRIARRLNAAGLSTLLTVAEQINARGQGWHRGISAIGATKARRIVEWLRETAPLTGLQIGGHALVPRKGLAPELLLGVVPKATDLVPLEKLIVPAEFDGREGVYRAPQASCLLPALDDYEAVAAWLASKGPGNQGALSATQRAYRKEAERLLLWAVLLQRKALSSLAVEDAQAYMRFLERPPEAWCGPRHHPRWSPLWRPLEGPLEVAASTRALTILRGLFTWLNKQGYLVGNPFSGVARPLGSDRRLGARRALSANQMAFSIGQLRRLPADHSAARLRLAVGWLYATGLRLTEMVSARCGDLVACKVPEGRDPAWVQNVVGRGGQLRQVNVPGRLIAQLSQILEIHGLPPDVGHPENARVPLLAKWVDGAPEPISAGRLYKTLKHFFGACALALEVEDPEGASRLRSASTHWLRHTHVAHAVNGSTGAEPVAHHYVQANVGHASPQTTAQYILADTELRMAAMRQFLESID